MLKHKTDLKERDISVSDRGINIYFLENGESVLLELPSAEELAQLKAGYTGKFSVEKLSSKDVFGLYDSYRDELERLSRMSEKYKDSSTFLVNLANLSDLMGDYATSEKFLREATKFDNAELIKHEVGESLIKQNKLAEASSFFKLIDKDNDSYTKVRLAYFCALNGDFDLTRQYVEEALKIAPDSYENNLFYGALSLWAGELEMAVRSFRVAIEANPYSSVAHVNLAAAYWRLNLKQKAYSSLKRSLILDPLNENAAIFYSDVCFFISRIEGKREKVEESLTVLEKLLNYEQRSKSVWEQAARAYYFVGKEKRNRSMLLRAYEAIKHLESLDSGPGTWNNMGLIAWELGDRKAAKRYLNFSLKKALEQSQAADLPLYNLIGLHIEGEEYKEAYEILKPLLNNLQQAQSNGKFLDKLKLQHIVLLEATGRRKDALNLTKTYLETGLSQSEVTLDLLIRVIYFYTTYEPNLEKILEYEERTLTVLDNSSDFLSQTRDRALNNLAFALLNFGNFEKATKYLEIINSRLYKDPFITATFGLAAIKKGLPQKGKELYQKAIALLPDSKSKNQFRQRMNFELGKDALASGQLTQARRLLEKASNEKDGFSYVRRDVNQMFQKLLPKT